MQLLLPPIWGSAATSLQNLRTGFRKNFKLGFLHFSALVCVHCLENLVKQLLRLSFPDGRKTLVSTVTLKQRSDFRLAQVLIFVQV